jgi:hypothetical protein
MVRDEWKIRAIIVGLEKVDGLLKKLKTIRSNSARSERT